MDNVDEVFQAILIGTLVADFLLNTNRILKAIDLLKECLLLLKSAALEKEAAEFVKSVYRKTLSIKVFNSYVRISDHRNGIDWGKRLLVMLRNSDDRDTEGRVAFDLATLQTLHLQQSECTEATELYERALYIVKEIRGKHGEAEYYEKLGSVFRFRGDHAKAKECIDKALAITREIGDREREASCLGALGSVFYYVGECVKAKDSYMKALQMKKEIGDKGGEVTDYGNLGTIFTALGEYTRAIEYFKKALEITKEIGDKKTEATWYGNLGSVFSYKGDYAKAEEYLQKALAISKRIGDKHGEADDYGNLGTVSVYRGDYAKAKQYHEKALTIRKEICDKRGEAASYGEIGAVLASVGEYVKAKEHFQKGLKIRREIGDRLGEASDCGNLGSVLKSLGDFVKAREYLEKALAITTEIGDRKGEASSYGLLAHLCRSLGEYVTAEEFFKKALAITKEIGDKRGEGATFAGLGSLFEFLGENVKAVEYRRKALAIATEIDDRSREASCYGSLGFIFASLRDYVQAKEYLEQALAIKLEIGDRSGEAECYERLGVVFQSLGEYVKAEEYHRKALSIAKEIGHIEREASCYVNLGIVVLYLGKYAKAKEYYDKGLAISRKIGDVETEFKCYVYLSWTMILQGNLEEASSNLFVSIEKCEHLRHFLKDNDQFKISFSDVHAFPYRMLSSLFCVTGKPYQALYVIELGRARALADLMSAQYFVGRRISVNPQSWVGIEKVMEKERSCTCLYISYFSQDVFLWILKADKTVLFRQINVNEHSVTGEFVQNLDDFWKKNAFRKFHFLPQKHCEDRSLLSLNTAHSKHQFQKERKSREKGANQDPETSLALHYKLVIAPVADLLDQPEIIIVPDRSLYKVPFAALKDGRGKYLSETYRIRIIPSLTTLKLIHEIPKEDCTETLALIVGDPDVSYVSVVPQLPCAREEAELIGGLLGVQPLLGHQATKLAVLDGMHSASLIHFAAHGDAESGEIALAPVRPVNKILHREDFSLTMSDVAQVNMRAKLVVLSCCHSGCGEIRPEGVVGIARAFLGSGARSVLVALWAIEDKATKQLMSRFYEHLVCGESASESLHHAMRWMGGNSFSDVRQWAPFMLIGDNVTFDFGK